MHLHANAYILRELENIKDIFNLLSTDKIIHILRKIIGINELIYDPYLHVSDLHSHPKYGRLNMHLDYEKHPISGKERRLNLIYFTNDDWKEEYNGDLQLWDTTMSKLLKKIYPKFNRAVIFKTSDYSWHGLPDKIICPDNMYRNTLAYYWISELCTKKQIPNTDIGLNSLKDQKINKMNAWINYIKSVNTKT